MKWEADAGDSAAASRISFPSVTLFFYAAIPLSYKYLGAKPISSFQSMVNGSRRNDLK